ncbi:MAG: dihydrolipoamide acyltransferase [Nitrosomonadales bacterium SCN 54-20]|nr:MAG: dihydrolipoamide acyltransferase [Nitrosomonadales bacterium SCN 54-20]
MRSVPRTGGLWLVLPVAALMFLAACAAIESVESPRAVEPLPTELVVTGQMDDMMEFYDSIRKQSPVELIRVYDKAKQSFMRNKSDTNRARLVLLLILPNTSFRDVTSATHLLNEWPKDSKSANNLQSFRNLLVSLLAEQQRLNHSIEELSQKLKDEQKRAETLQSQINAIKSMEKNLLKEL